VVSSIPSVAMMTRRSSKAAVTATPRATGCALMGAGCILLLRVHATSGYGPVWWPFVIIGAAYELISTPMAAAVLGAAPKASAGMASSTNLTARVAGGVFGIAVLGTLLPSTHATHQGLAAAFTLGMHCALVVPAAWMSAAGHNQ
jgi:hypothetical protein